MNENTNTSPNEELLNDESTPLKIKTPKQIKREKKKAAKKEKKLAKKAAKEAIPKNRPAVLNPFLVTTEGKYYLGLCARAFSIAFMAFALVYFFLDTIDLMQYTSAWSVFACCIFFTFPVVFSMQNKWAVPISLGIYAIWILYLIFVSNFTVSKLLRVFTNLFDSIIARLIDNGFDGLIGIDSGFGLIMSMETTVKCISVTLSLMFSLAFALSLGRKAHLYTPIALNALIVAPSFICNITNTNWGTSIIFVSFCVLAVMYASDKLFSDMTNPKRYDTETVLNPAFIIGVDTPITEDKKDRKERLKKEKKEKKEKKILLNDEIDDLLSAKKPKASKSSNPKTKAEKEALRAEKNILHLKKYAKSAISGFTALSILLAGYISIIVPSAVIDKNFRKIDFMDGTISNLREIITAWLLGDELTLDLKSFENDESNFAERSTDLTPRIYEGMPRFDVEVQRVMPVYLRGWIANSYKDGSWYLDMNDEAFIEFREKFGVRDDIHESLYDSFLSYMLPSDYDTSANYLNTVGLNTAYGYVTMQVNIERYFGGTTALYTPSFLNSRFGIRQYRSVYKNEDIGISNFFDGIFTSRHSVPGAQYAIVSNIPTMENVEYKENMSTLIAEFNAQIDYIKFALQNDPLVNPPKEIISGGGWGSVTKPNNDYFFKAQNISSANKTPNANGSVVSATSNEGITPLGYPYTVVRGVTPINEVDVNTTTITVFRTDDILTYVYDTMSGDLLKKSMSLRHNSSSPAAYVPDLELSLRYFHLFSKEQKDELNEYLAVYDLYSEYVKKHYTESSESEIIKDFASQFKLDSAYLSEGSEFSENSYLAIYSVISEIIEYLDENYEYTLTPSSTGESNLTGVENFIENVKEGYCVQFASTLALTLRELGIPTRYVEGYVATGFKINPSYRHDYSDPNLKEAPNGLHYRTRVYDHNEHAWIEAWIDGIGWVQFEATPTFSANYYPPEKEETTTGPNGSESIPVEESTEDPDVSDTSDSLPDDSTSEVPEETSGTNGILGNGTVPFTIPEELIIALICIIIIALIALIIYLIIKRAQSADIKRVKFLDDAVNATEKDDIKSFSSMLSHLIFELLRIYKLSPNPHEFPYEYRSRLARDIILTEKPPLEKTETTEDYDASDDTEDSAEESLSEEEVLASEEYKTVDAALEALEAEEFGAGMSQNEIKASVELYKTLLSFKKRKLNFLKIILYRYILNKV